MGAAAEYTAHSRGFTSISHGHPGCIASGCTMGKHPDPPTAAPCMQAAYLTSFFASYHGILQPFGLCHPVLLGRAESKSWSKEGEARDPSCTGNWSDKGSGGWVGVYRPYNNPLQSVCILWTNSWQPSWQQTTILAQTILSLCNPARTNWWHLLCSNTSASPWHWHYYVSIFLRFIAVFWLVTF